MHYIISSYQLILLVSVEKKMHKILFYLQLHTMKQFKMDLQYKSHIDLYANSEIIYIHLKGSYIQNFCLRLSANRQ